ncbi:unnamed protein product [Acanthoscelides obtectus]|uniref:DUF7041 domain-containing protein n=1 Tax=Acanthoscelides obtectus TaxID=200917 RepID=A0A9P0KPL0_ACAOB|nr:unnamed protein product [Acanthoscelides obtectus]CAK1622133.1 hypothetical protein AOBTE_LOCUS1326 [Acanthoscelides obtectus]
MNVELTTDAEVACVSMKPMKRPPFWPEKPALWFAKVECQFYMSRITKDNTKFTYIISHLDGKYAAEEDK